MIGGEPTPVLLAGPTAVGKSEIALRLAEQLRGEVVSVDSMQVYRGLDVGTAKPGADERARVRHHLIDVVSLSEAFDVARFIQLASAAMQEIQQRGAVPILCGGTGLYFKGLLEGVGKAPAAPPKLRAELERTPLAQLLDELRAKDPATFERIDRKNSRRVIRAVEVLRLTGRPFSEQQSAWSHSSPVPFYCFIRAKEDLQARIDARVDAMFARGLVEETRRAMAEGLESNPTAMQAIGYRQVVDYLHGRLSLPETIDLVKVRTRQYAKRQLTWFRRQPVTWIELAGASDPAAVVADIRRAVKAINRFDRGRPA